MTWKPKKPDTMDSTWIEMWWEKWGTWISGGVALVLAGVLVWILVQRYYESQAAKGRLELERITMDDPTATMQFTRLARDYGSTTLGPVIQLKLAQYQYHNGDLTGAEKTLGGLRGNKAIAAVDHAQADLLLAYIATERGDIAEAKKRFETVENDGLYVDEAKHMMQVLDREAKEGPAPVPAAPEPPKAPETPKTPKTPETPKG